jgi:hypothetical protein
MDHQEIHTSLNFRHSACSPHCQMQPDPLDSKEPPSTSRKEDVCQILLKK